MPWFAVRTQARAEKTVRDYLADREVEVFLPTVIRRQQWKDRVKAVEFPLFPGYCFARVEPGHHLTVLKCPRVAQIVSFGGTPCPLPDHEIESLRTLVKSDLHYDETPFIPDGSLVTVIAGPLTGVVGRLVRHENKARLVLSVSLIAQAVSVEVNSVDVRLCSS